MKSGEIVLNGNAQYDVGFSLEGGIIRLNGEYGCIGPNIRGGDIYHKDKLIVKDGERV